MSDGGLLATGVVVVLMDAVLATPVEFRRPRLVRRAGQARLAAAAPAG